MYENEGPLDDTGDVFGCNLNMSKLTRDQHRICMKIIKSHHMLSQLRLSQLTKSDVNPQQHSSSRVHSASSFEEAAIPINKLLSNSAICAFIETDLYLTCIDILARAYELVERNSVSPGLELWRSSHTIKSRSHDIINKYLIKERVIEQRAKHTCADLKKAVRLIMSWHLFKTNV